MVADEPKKQADMLPPLIVLQSQTACTEIRGGQAGGYSTLEYAASTGRDTQVHRSGALDNQEGTTSFPITSGPPPKNMRVRLVARKRHPLAADLAALYVNRGGHAPAAGATFTVIGHTRFATSSANVESELHPHEWVPFHDEFVWSFDAARGTFNRTKRRVGLHLSHNGDFDAMEAYSQTMVVEEVGLWLERIHHVPNNTRGDSPKVSILSEMLYFRCPMYTQNSINFMSALFFSASRFAALWICSESKDAGRQPLAWPGCAAF
jgi:hypothetical protein